MQPSQSTKRQVTRTLPSPWRARSDSRNGTFLWMYSRASPSCDLLSDLLNTPLMPPSTPKARFQGQAARCAAQAGRVHYARSLPSGDLRRQGAQPPQAGEPVFHAQPHDAGRPQDAALLEAIWDFEWHLAGSEPEALLLEGRLIRNSGPATISVPPRPTSVPAGEGGPEGGMAAVPPHADEERRDGEVFRALRPRRGIAADAGFHAEEIWSADVWPGPTPRSAN